MRANGRTQHVAVLALRPVLATFRCRPAAVLGPASLAAQVSDDSADRNDKRHGNRLAAEQTIRTTAADGTGWTAIRTGRRSTESSRLACSSVLVPTPMSDEELTQRLVDGGDRLPPVLSVFRGSGRGGVVEQNDRSGLSGKDCIDEHLDAGLSEILRIHVE